MDTLSIAIVGLYTGLNALILIWIFTKTVGLRGKLKISIGDGDNKHMQRIMRGHANAVESMSIVLILLLVMAALGTPALVLHGFGLVFTFSRLIHAWHFIQEDAARWQRFYGAVLTLAVTLVLAIGVIGHSIIIMMG